MYMRVYGVHVCHEEETDRLLSVSTKAKALLAREEDWANTARQGYALPK